MNLRLCIKAFVSFAIIYRDSSIVRLYAICNCVVLFLKIKGLTAITVSL